jgi:hypothetical protein
MPAVPAANVTTMVTGRVTVLAAAARLRPQVMTAMRSILNLLAGPMLP